MNIYKKLESKHGNKDWWKSAWLAVVALLTVPSYAALESESGFAAIAFVAALLLLLHRKKSAVHRLLQIISVPCVLCSKVCIALVILVLIGTCPVLYVVPIGGRGFDRSW